MLTVHHRMKRSQGGTWDPSNLLLLCGDGTTGCHGWVEAHPEAAQAQGLWLTPNVDTQSVPYLAYGRYWLRIDDEGNKERMPDVSPHSEWPGFLDQ